MKIKIFFAVLILIFISACGPAREEIVERESIKLQELAQQINKDFSDTKNRVYDLSRFTALLYENQDQYDLGSHHEMCTVSPDGVLYKSKNDQGSAIFVSGHVPVNEKIMKIVAFTSPLDQEFKKIVRDLPDVAQVYYNDEYSYNRIYPFFDVLSQYEPGMNIPSFNFYYLADLKHNPDKKAVWVDEPYVDPAGRGWMISAIAPVYYNGRLVGVPGIDVTVNTIIDRYLKENPSILILDGTGVLVAVNDNLVHLLSLPPLENHQYLETIKSDQYRKDDYNLLKSKDRIIRQMADAIVVGRQKSVGFSIGKDEYISVAVFMDDLHWSMVNIIAL